MNINISENNKIFNKYKVIRNSKEECNHPLFIVVGRQDCSNYGIYNEVRCIMCNKEINIKDRIEKNKILEDLYQNKQLLAKYRGLAKEDNLPMFDYMDTYIKDMTEPTEDMRKVYLEYCDEAQELIENGYLSKDFSFESSFFDSMCSREHIKYLKDKELIDTKVKRNSL